MRILLTTAPAAGHLFPVVLAARGCAVRGPADLEGVRSVVRDVVDGKLHDAVAGLADDVAAMTPPSAAATELITRLA